MKRIFYLALPNTTNLKRKSNLRRPFSAQQFRLLIALLFISATTYAQTPNQYTPIAIGSGPFTGSNLVVTSSGEALGVGVVNPANLVSASTTDFVSVTSPLGAYIEVDYSGGTFPAGSDIGFIVNKGLLSLGLLSGISVTTYTDAKPAFGDGTMAETRNGTNLLGLGLLTNREKIGFVTTQPFRRVRLTFTGLNLGSIVAAVQVYNAEILIPQAATLPTACNTTSQLNQTIFPSVATYGTTSAVGSGGLAAADVAGILNQIQDVNNIVSSSTTDYARLSPINASVAGEGYLSVKLLSGTVPKDYYAGFEIENINGGLLSNVNLLNGMTVQVLNGNTVVQSMSAFQILSASILSGGVSTGRQTLGFLVTAGAFNEIRLVFSSGLLAAGATLGETRIYNAVVRNFCDAATPLGATTILANGHASANNMGVAVSGGNSGLANASAGNAQTIANSMANLIDNDASNYVSLSNTLGISASNAASVAVTTPAHTFTNDEYTGFVVKAGSPLVNLGLLTGVTISTYNNGALVEQADLTNSLLQLNALNVLSVNGDVPADAQLLYFKTTGDFDEVRLTVNNLAGIGSELQVYNAFVSANAALPVDFGDISAVFENNRLQIDWSTISETNNKEFVVEGSADGNTWVKLGTVASKAEGGSSDTAISYSFSKTLEELMVLSGFSLLSAMVLMIVVLMLFPSIKRRKAYFMTPVLAIALALVSFSCTKSKDAYQADEEPIAYIRIAQIDKDGTRSYSKVVKVVHK